MNAQASRTEWWPRRFWENGSTKSPLGDFGGERGRGRVAAEHPFLDMPSGAMKSPLTKLHRSARQVKERMCRPHPPSTSLPSEVAVVAHSSPIYAVFWSETELGHTRNDFTFYGLLSFPVTTTPEFGRRVISAHFGHHKTRIREISASGRTQAVLRLGTRIFGFSASQHSWGCDSAAPNWYHALLS